MMERFADVMSHFMATNLLFSLVSCLVLGHQLDAVTEQTTVTVRHVDTTFVTSILTQLCNSQSTESFETDPDTKSHMREPTVVTGDLPITTNLLSSPPETSQLQPAPSQPSTEVGSSSDSASSVTSAIAIGTHTIIMPTEQTIAVTITTDGLTLTFPLPPPSSHETLISGTTAEGTRTRITSDGVIIIGTDSFAIPTGFSTPVTTARNGVTLTFSPEPFPAVSTSNGITINSGTDSIPVPTDPTIITTGGVTWNISPGNPPSSSTTPSSMPPSAVTSVDNPPPPSATQSTINFTAPLNTHTSFENPPLQSSAPSTMSSDMPTLVDKNPPSSATPSTAPSHNPTSFENPSPQLSTAVSSSPTSASTSAESVSSQSTAPSLTPHNTATTPENTISHSTAPSSTEPSIDTSIENSPFQSVTPSSVPPGLSTSTYPESSLQSTTTPSSMSENTSVAMDSLSLSVPASSAQPPNTTTSPENPPSPSTAPSSAPSSTFTSVENPSQSAPPSSALSNTSASPENPISPSTEPSSAPVNTVTSPTSVSDLPIYTTWPPEASIIPVTTVVPEPTVKDGNTELPCKIWFLWVVSCETDSATTSCTTVQSVITSGCSQMGATSTTFAPACKLVPTNYVNIVEVERDTFSHTSGVVTITATGPTQTDTGEPSNMPTLTGTAPSSSSSGECLSLSTFTSCHFVGGRQGSICVPTSTCVRWRPAETPSTGNRCEQDGECSNYKCAEGERPGCLVRGLGGERSGSCQCLQIATSSTVEGGGGSPPETTMTTTSQEPKKTPPPDGFNCNSAADCAIWTCVDGSKPGCSSHGSGDPFTQHCRC
ncbi:hypothetical protein DCS_05150 [Drechmeria coniospora]|uniref:Uncharacterized protein n=1 Tax=Drechmeria coniospora TaxID=98403 RepID=A0A151GM04_DRECN|nr:hypothetical protein DCS_05150 [Drechmeria coniospora]KYK58137.1 hypothetical protein DCS_05150 [Drechmeria coniospora]